MSGPRILVDRVFQLAENPVWDVEGNRFLWTDIDAGAVLAMDWTSGVVSQMYTGPQVGGFTTQRDGSLLLFREQDVAVMDARSTVTPILQIPDSQVRRFNDCLALPNGEVMVGTITWPKPGAALHHLARNGTFTTVATGTTVSNGLALSPDQKWLYWTCSTTGRIYRYPFDPTADGPPTGERTIVHQEPQGTGTPDGLTADTEGRLYSARWGGSAVLVLDPNTGAITQRIEMPGKNVTSCAFAGPDLDVLVVTIANGPIVAVEGVGKGMPEFRSAIEPRPR